MSDSKNAIFEGLESIVGNGVNRLMVEETETLEPAAKTTTDSAEVEAPKIEFSVDELDNLHKSVSEETTEDIINEVKTKGTKVEKTETPIEESEEVVEDAASIYKAVSNIFKEEGFIETEFDSAEKMVEVFSKRIEEEVNDYKESLPPIVKEIINNYEEGVPLEDLIKSKSEQIKYSSIDEEKLETDEDLQKLICKQYLKETTRYSDEKINKEIKKLAEAGELFDEAKSNKKELVQIEKETEKVMIANAKKAQEDARIQYQKEIKELHKSVSSVKEIIPGVKLSDKENEEIFKMMTSHVEVVGNQPVSHAMKVREADPVKFDMTLNYLIKKGVFEGKWDSIMKTTETKVVTKLEKELKDAAAKAANKGGASAPLPETDKSKATLNGLKDAVEMRKSTLKQ